MSLYYALVRQCLKAIRLTTLEIIEANYLLQM